MKPQLGWKKEAVAGTSEFTAAGVASTVFGHTIPSDAFVFPLASHEATLSYKDGDYTPGKITKGANNVHFSIARTYNHGYPWVMALGNVEDLTGGKYKVTAGALSSYSVYSRYDTAIAAVGCKVNELDVIAMKKMPMMADLSFIGTKIVTPTTLTNAPAQPADIEDFVGGWVITPGDLTLGSANLARCDGISVKILRGVTAVHTNSRDARRVHDPEIVSFIVNFTGDFDGEKDELIEAILDDAADAGFHWKIDIDGTHYHQVDIDTLDLQTPRVQGSEDEPNTYDVVASGYGAFEVELYDGHDYTSL